MKSGPNSQCQSFRSRGDHTEQNMTSRMTLIFQTVQQRPGDG